MLAKYVITDGSKFVYKNFKNKYTFTSSEVMADTFSKKQAENILNNQINKNLRKNMRIERSDESFENVKELTVESINDNSVKVENSEEINTWIEKIKSMNGLFVEAKTRKDELYKKLSKEDRKISDLLHYIEFSRLNAAQGYSVFKMLKDICIQRRIIKNEIQVVELILGDSFKNESLDVLLKRIKAMDERLYTPRELEELFDY